METLRSEKIFPDRPSAHRWRLLLWKRGVDNLARTLDPRIEQAKKLYDAGEKLIDIADQLGVPEGTIRSWKKRYWGNVAKKRMQRCKRKEAHKKGGTRNN